MGWTSVPVVLVGVNEDRISGSYCQWFLYQQGTASVRDLVSN